jgi:hypothetical protein
LGAADFTGKPTTRELGFPVGDRKQDLVLFEEMNEGRREQQQAQEQSNGQEQRVAAPITEVVFATGEDQANQNDCHESDNDECCPRRWFQLLRLPLLHVTESVHDPHARANQMSGFLAYRPSAGAPRSIARRPSKELNWEHESK